MSIKTKDFGTGQNGTSYRLYTIDNGRMQCSVTDLGACLVRVLVPAADGDGFDDVVLGYDSAEEYLSNPDFYGALVGPSANRVKEGLVPIDDKTYRMDINNDTNNLHTDPADGLHKRKWQAEFFEKENRVTFTIHIEDGTYHLPGNRTFRVSYILEEQAADAKESEVSQSRSRDDEREIFGGIKIVYEGSSDKNTLMNLTNHTYFNLNGHGIHLSLDDETDTKGAHAKGLLKSNEENQSGTSLKPITNHSFKLYASRFTPIDASLIPTGELRDVKGTVFDFDKLHSVGADIDADDEQIKIAGGFDHNFVLDAWKNDSKLKKDAKLSPAGNQCVHPCARVYEPESGRHILAETTLPGVQFYSGNFMQNQTGKYGCDYARRTGFCLETQFFPSAINVEAFKAAGYPKPVFGPNRPFRATTVYTFGRIFKD